MKKVSVVNSMIVLLAALLATWVVYAVPGCVTETPVKHAPDVIAYTSTAPQIIAAVTTQKAAVEKQLQTEHDAGGLVASADGKVSAVNTEKPDPRLASAHEDLAKAGGMLTDNEKRMQATIDSQAKSIKDLAEHVTADDALLATARQEAAGKAKALDALSAMTTRAEKAEGFINEHKNDVWGAGTHRWVKGLRIAALVIITLCIVALGIVGSLYGAPAVIKPAATTAGMFLDWARVAIYHAATFIWSSVFVVGHYIDEALNELRLHRQSGTVTQVVTPAGK